MKPLLALALLAPTAVLAQTAAIPTQTITVSGSAESKAAPDRATIRLGVETQAKTAKEAQASTSALAARIVDAALPVVPDRKAYQTSDLSLEPVYQNLPNQEPRITGYRARNILTVRVDDVSKVGPLVDVVTDAGATNVDSIAFGLKDSKAARRQALGDAVRDARDKAEAIAAGLGVRLYAAYSVEEGGAVVRPYEVPMMAMRVRAETPVMPGEVTVGATVTVRFTFTLKEIPAPGGR